MAYPILGLHHVTATVDDAQADLDFCVGALGLRLVKKTVNFDNHHVYHFYYGDERGTPGNDLDDVSRTAVTACRSAPRAPARSRVTSFSVPGRLARRSGARGSTTRGIEVTERRTALRRGVDPFADPSGLAIELSPTAAIARRRGLAAASTRTPRFAACTASRWSSRSGADARVHDRAARLSCRRRRRRAHPRWRQRRRTRARPSTSSSDPMPRRPRQRPRHRASRRDWRSIAPDEQLLLREELVALRLQGDPGPAIGSTSESIYFREPGGVLLEVATMAPGFAVDEPLAKLGRGSQAAAVGGAKPISDRGRPAGRDNQRARIALTASSSSRITVCPMRG